MMLYLDTSALVKLYVDEPLAQELSAAVDEAEAVATSLLPMLKPGRRSHARAGRRGSLLTRIVTSSMHLKRIGPAI